MAASTEAPRQAARPTGEGVLRRLLIAGGDPAERREWQVFLVRRGFDVVAAGDVTDAIRELRDRDYDCVLADAAHVAALASADPGVTIVGVGGGERDGAWDSVGRPVTGDALGPVMRRVADRVALRRRIAELESATPPELEGGELGLVGDSEPMRRVLREMAKVAPYKTNVLITGESGTGKELVARGLHRLSRRAHGAFVAVNCGAIPGPLLESELFGHRRGAFTDAVRDKRGMFEEADGGTLFLDEIGELPLALQVKLLRALQEEEIRAVGADESRTVDVRIVAATVRDLDAEVAHGRFREDLYYRLNVLALRLPPLRERTEDVPVLVDHFIRAYGHRHGHAGAPPRRVSDEAMAMLASYAWPGNIRELENTIERAMVLCEGEVIEAEVLEDKLRSRPVPATAAAAPDEELSIKKASRALERRLIERALEQTDGNRTAAARLLEISHRALLYKIKEYDL